MRAIAVAGAVALAAGCSGGDSEDAEKIVRQGATATVADGLVWVVGGSSGPTDALNFGDVSSWTIEHDVRVYDLDGNDVGTIALDLDDATAITLAAVAPVGDRAVVVGGRCVGQGAFFGCGPTGPFVALLDLEAETAEELAVGDPTSGGEARLVGAAGGQAWVLVDRFGDPRVIRLDAATGETADETLPELAWTGDTCAGPDGLVNVVADLGDDFVAHSVEVWHRPLDDGAEWRATGTVSLEDRHAGVLRLFCLGGGQVLLDIGDAGSGPIAIAIDSATVAAEAPADLKGESPAVHVAVDGDGTGAVAWVQRFDARDSLVFAYDVDSGWRELGEIRTAWSAPPSFALVDGEVVDVGGAAVLDGVAAREVSVAR